MSDAKAPTSPTSKLFCSSCRKSHPSCRTFSIFITQVEGKGLKFILFLDLAPGVLAASFADKDKQVGR